MRTFFILIILISYTLSTNLYIWYFTNTNMDIAYLKAWYGGSILITLLLYKMDEKLGTVSWLQENFREIIFYSVCINVFITLLTHLAIIDKDDFCAKYYIFDGGILFVSLCVLISGGVHGLFKK